MSKPTAREILENMAGIDKNCTPRMSIDKALEQLRGIMPGKKSSKDIMKIHKSHREGIKRMNWAYNQYHDKVMEILK